MRRQSTIRAIGNAPLSTMRRQSTAGTLGSGPSSTQHPESHEVVQLSHAEAHQHASEALRTFSLVVLEMVDTALEITNLATYLRAMDELDTYAVLYKISTALVVGLSGYMMGVHIQQIANLRREMHMGVRVERGRRRMQLARGKSGSVAPSCPEDVGPSSGKTVGMGELLDVRVERLRRRSFRAWLIVMSAIAEDFVVLVFAIYRVAFTRVLVKPENGRCLIDPSNTPMSCIDWPLFLTLIQIASGFFFVAFKISYYRDYATLRELIQELEHDISEEGVYKGSYLDRFSLGEVQEGEINSVVAVRTLLARVASDTNVHICTDLQILQFLRRCFGDEVQTTRALYEWLKWRQERKAGGALRELLISDLSWDGLPFARRLFSAIPLVDMAVVDVRSKCLVLYGYVGSNADFGRALDEVSEAQMRTCAIFMIERITLLLEHLSKTHGLVLGCSILCDARGAVSASDTSAFFARLGAACAGLVCYPVIPKVKLFKPASTMLGCLDKLSRSSLERVQVFHDEIALRCALSDDAVPVELGGSLSLWPGVPSSADPWLVKKCQPSRLSTVLGRREIDLHFFKGVSHVEADGVVAVRKLLSEAEKEARKKRQQKSDGPASPNSRFAFRRGSSASILLRAAAGTATALTSPVADPESREVFEKLIESFADALASGADPKDMPPEALSNVTLLRVLRRARGGSAQGALAFVKVMRERHAHGLNSAHRLMKETNACMDSMPRFAGLRRALWPINGAYQIDQQAGIIVCVTEQRKDLASTDDWSQNQLQDAFIEMYEFLATVADRLSAKMEIVVRIAMVHRIESKTSFYKTYERLLVAQRAVERMYPGLVRPEHIAIIRASFVLRDELLSVVGKLYSDLERTGKFRAFYNRRDLPARLEGHLPMSLIPIVTNAARARRLSDISSLASIPFDKFADSVVKFSGGGGGDTSVKARTGSGILRSLTPTSLRLSSDRKLQATAESQQQPTRRISLNSFRVRPAVSFRDGSNTSSTKKLGASDFLTVGLQGRPLTDM